MSKQERIAECEEIFKFYENKHSNPSYGFDQVTWDRLCFWESELESAQAMPDDTVQVSEAEIFLLEATKDTEIEFEIDATNFEFHATVDLDLNMKINGALAIALILHSSGTCVMTTYIDQLGYVAEIVEFAKVVQFASEIAQKWQAHVKDNS